MLKSHGNISILLSEVVHELLLLRFSDRHHRVPLERAQGNRSAITLKMFTFCLTICSWTINVTYVEFYTCKYVYLYDSTNCKVSVMR